MSENNPTTLKTHTRSDEETTMSTLNKGDDPIIMETFIKAPVRFRFTLILLAMAVTAAALAAVVFAANPTWAQDSGTGTTDGGSADDYPNLSTYPDPQPCGPGAGTAFMEEPHEITTGHYALFDAYWRTIATSTVPDGDGVGVLHTNLCPPEMVATTTGSGFGGGTVTTIRSARTGGMDIEEAIIHVLDTHQATTTVASTTEATDRRLSLAEYPRVGEVVDPGDRVWWLRLDDPDTEDDPNTPEKENDETSDLGIGFSTLLLDEERWLTRDDGKPMRYRFEVERHPADPTDVPHFFAYEAPNIKAEGSDTEVKLVWDSSQPGKGVVELNPGEYKALQWVFTKPGTYLLWVHLLGDVREPPAGANWNAISSNETETSEVYRYTIQVGTPLDEIEPPIFGVNLMVDENSPGGVEVGDPIPVYNADADVLYYDLTGPGHSNFELVAASSTAPHTVQVAVADGAKLDYETKPSYDLHLTVTDKVDHEDNFNPYADDVLIVRIDLKDQAPGMVLRADRTELPVGETVNFFARFEPTPEQSELTPTYEWGRKIGEGLYHYISDAPNAPTWSVSHSAQTTETYRVAAVEGGLSNLTFATADVEVTWTNPN